jgi:hypothetical protein
MPVIVELLGEHYLRGDFQTLVELANFDPHLFPQFGIQIGKRFIEEQ